MVTFTQLPTSPSKKDIIEIGLAGNRSSVQWITDPDGLTKQITVLSNATGPMPLSQAIFREREGRVLVVNVIKDKKANNSRISS